MKHSLIAQPAAANETPMIGFWPSTFWSPAAWLPQSTIAKEPNVKSRQENKVADESRADFGNVLQSFNPIVKAMTDTSSEFIALAMAHAKTVTEIPVKVGQCKAPLDLIPLQMQVWQSAFSLQTEAVKRVMATWQSVMPLAFAVESGNGQSSNRSTVRPPAASPRDVMTLAATPELADGVPPAPSTTLPLAAKRPLNDRRSVA